LTSRAVALHGMGRRDEAVRAWESALRLGEREGYVRVYREGAVSRLDLLRQTSVSGPVSALARRVLEASGDAEGATEPDRHPLFFGQCPVTQWY
jgi:hypothetical protein